MYASYFSLARLNTFFMFVFVLTPSATKLVITLSITLIFTPFFRILRYKSKSAYARKKICIGDNTLIGGNAKIIDNDFHPIDSNLRLEQIYADHPGELTDIIPTKEVIIGKNCFIGCNSIILKGTVLGDNCVVGAGAVVSGRFEDNCIIAGNPAKVIKKLS